MGHTYTKKNCLLLLLNLATLSLGGSRGSTDRGEAGQRHTRHGAASRSPVQNLPGQFGSRTVVGTGHENDMKGRPRPGGGVTKLATAAAAAHPRDPGVPPAREAGSGPTPPGPKPRPGSSGPQSQTLPTLSWGSSRTWAPEPSSQDPSPRRDPQGPGTFGHVRVDTRDVGVGEAGTREGRHLGVVPSSPTRASPGSRMDTASTRPAVAGPRVMRPSHTQQGPWGHSPPECSLGAP